MLTVLTGRVLDHLADTVTTATIRVGHACDQAADRLDHAAELLRLLAILTRTAP